MSRLNVSLTLYLLTLTVHKPAIKLKCKMVHTRRHIVILLFKKIDDTNFNEFYYFCTIKLDWSGLTSATAVQCPWLDESIARHRDTYRTASRRKSIIIIMRVASEDLRHWWQWPIVNRTVGRKDWSKRLARGR